MFTVALVFFFTAMSLNGVNGKGVILNLENKARNRCFYETRRGGVVIQTLTDIVK
jgi:hypothetical protein